MPSIMEVVGILHGMDPNPLASNRVEDMPPWMQELYRKMIEAGTLDSIYTSKVDSATHFQEQISI